jgi:hypothetical protein
MNTNKIIIRFFLVLIVLIISYFSSCDKEEWCADCEWFCTSIEPLFGDESETICADSRENCEAAVQEWLDNRFITSCWECSGPYRK